MSYRPPVCGLLDAARVPPEERAQNTGGLAEPNRTQLDGSAVHSRRAAIAASDALEPMVKRFKR